MIPDILIHSADTIAKLDLSCSHIIVSIRSPGAPLAMLPKSKHCLGVLRQAFYDVEQPCAIVRPRKRVIHPISPRQAAEAAAFILRFLPRVECVVFQCEAGISRSAGMASALSLYLRGDESAINFHRHMPNTTVKTLMLRHLRAGGK